MRIVPFPAENAALREQAAAQLTAAFPHPTGWPTLADALDEIDGCLADGKLCLAALGDDGALLGWIGAFPMSHAVWELHPLVVRADTRRRGVGRALVLALEGEVLARGGATIWLGAGDEQGGTSLAGVDLYPDPLAHLARLTSDDRHAAGFYRRLGYALCGVLPDEYGRGLHTIYFAKRVTAPAGGAGHGQSANLAHRRG
jgi:aminoglycoside 6'-N-acetyltransferase I